MTKRSLTGLVILDATGISETRSDLKIALEGLA